MIKIAFFNNKGGVGKSTAAINVAHAMSRAGKKVVVIDCDEQLNSFRFFTAESEANNSGDTRYDNIYIECFGYDKALETCGVYDYALIDLPPALNDSKEVLALCDYVFVPIELGKFAVQGVGKVTETIAEAGANLGTCVFGGCFVNKFDRDNPADNKLDELLRQTLGGKVMATKIPYSRVVKNSVSYRQTAFEYAGKSKAAGAFAELTDEILEICGGRENG